MTTIEKALLAGARFSMKCVKVRGFTKFRVEARFIGKDGFTVEGHDYSHVWKTMAHEIRRQVPKEVLNSSTR